MSHPLQSHYDKIPEVKCKGLCQEACGPIMLNQKEVDEIRKEFGVRLGTDATMSCTALCKVSGACTVYAARPWVCRAYGAMEGLECPHGCNTAPLVSVEDGEKMIQAMGKAGGKLFCTIE
jgi:Fe-S-cluster containining protein